MKAFFMVGCMIVVAAGAVGQTPNNEAIPSGQFFKEVDKKSLSTEEIARDYFAQIAHIDESYSSTGTGLSAKDVLRDRDGLTDAEADEVIAVARSTKSPQKVQKARTDAELARRKTCADLKSASTAADKAAAIKTSQTLSYTSNRLSGANSLAELTPATRIHILQVLEEYKKSITVRRVDVSQVSPEITLAFESNYCAGIN